jgi:beta-lactamase regulating signal transducer with metallopeptidase domain
MSVLAFAAAMLQNESIALICKVTVVLGIAGAASVAMHRASAAQRHMVWLVALVACVGLAAASTLVPAHVIRVPATAMPATSILSQPAAEIIAPVSLPASDRSFALVAHPGHLAHPAHLAHVAHVAHPADLAHLAWIIGCLVLLCRYLVAFALAIRLAQRAVPATGPEWTAALARASAVVGLRRRVRLALSTEATAPMTIGFVSAVVILPSEAGEWSAARRHAVLVHELAHVTRGDAASQAIGWAAAALFWFHPLVWFAYARLRDEAERAADDRVLSAGTSPLGYAEHLLALAHRARRAKLGVAVSEMTGGISQLEWRFVAMFDIRRSRAAVSSRARAVGGSVALAVVFPLASLKFGAALPTQPAHAPVAIHLTQSVHPRAVAPTPVQTSRAPAVAEHALESPSPARVAAVVAVEAVEAQSPAPAAAIVESSTVALPNFSGTWKFLVGTDSSPGDTNLVVIRQTRDTLAIDRTGIEHGRSVSAHARIPLNGKRGLGMITAGGATAYPTSYATWDGSTLVIRTYIQSNGRDYSAIERLELSVDGTRLIHDVSNFLDGIERPGESSTSVAKRVGD